MKFDAQRIGSIEAARESLRKWKPWWCEWHERTPNGAMNASSEPCPIWVTACPIRRLGNILRRHRIAPAPKRGQTTSWRDFIAAHTDVLRNSLS
jgi:hypothetical protein